MFLSPQLPVEPTFSAGPSLARVTLQSPRGDLAAMGHASITPFDSSEFQPGTPNIQKEMDVSPNNHFLYKGFQLPYWNNHLFLVVWGSRSESIPVNSSGSPETLGKETRGNQVIGGLFRVPEQIYAQGSVFDRKLWAAFGQCLWRMCCFSPRS